MFIILGLSIIFSGSFKCPVLSTTLSFVFGGTYIARTEYVSKSTSKVLGLMRAIEFKENRQTHNKIYISYICDQFRI
jgi:hypothetical protein